MLKLLDGGWVTITIANKEICTAGNITDVPNEFLLGFIQLLTNEGYNNNGVVLTAYLEPGDVYVVFSQGVDTINNYYEVEDNDRVFLGKLNYVELAKELIQDIEKDVDNWLSFYTCLDNNKLKLKKNELLKNIKKLKKVLKEL